MKIEEMQGGFSITPKTSTMQFRLSALSILSERFSVKRSWGVRSPDHMLKTHENTCYVYAILLDTSDTSKI